MSETVCFVLDPKFQGDLWALSRSAHVWLIESEQNRAAAESVWSRETESPSSSRGVTTFKGAPLALYSFFGMLAAIDLHHPDWSAIRVIGLSADGVRPGQVAEELGLESVSLDEEPAGFSISRGAAP